MHQPVRDRPTPAAKASSRVWDKSLGACLVSFVAGALLARLLHSRRTTTITVIPVGGDLNVTVTGSVTPTGEA